ncbi:protein SPT2 homolog [Parasteatoda tepidariorum]|uniref:protein SPT2 homolog n=1 Tax=Parasteatoda tepidariorum TaxID=114398 RepID=UPI00077FDB93|nr:protein SPT2 homolog [Parasteatoda tepidariorum]
MDFRKLLEAANYNSHEAKHESSIKTYSTVLPPPKKVGKSTVQSDGIKKFLAKKKAEEDAKAAEARKQKERLLQLRSQSTKNNKKAKLMAARTKDNDFSKIKLSEDQVASKKKIEIELNRKHLKDKKERMKARIELEEKEAQLPRKRKRKSKNGGEGATQGHESDEPIEEEYFKKDKNPPSKNGFRKPPPPPVNFSELLKMAETKMHEPVVIPKKKEEGKLMTKKERRIYEEEQARMRRKQELLQKGIQPSLYNKTPSGKKENDKTLTKKPHVVHIEKNKTLNPSSESSSSKFKIPKSSAAADANKTNNGDSKIMHPNKSQSNNIKKLKPSGPNDRLQISKKENVGSTKPSVPQNSVPKKKPKIKPVSTSLPKTSSIPTIDADAIAADIERRVREKLEKQYAEKVKKQLADDLEKQIQAKLEKEIEEKYRLSLEEQRKKFKLQNEPVEKVKKPDISSKSATSLNGKVPQKAVLDKPPIKKSTDKPTIQKISAPQPPPKKKFHPNPYLDPPRRLLEPIIPPKKRRVIEDYDEDDDDDSDMDSFIDDGPAVDDENYSQYIKQIFGYDRNKYIDCDDDDIQESSYQEQMKEEMRSTRLGYMEDLEEERKLREEEKARKVRMKKKK